MKLSVCIPVKNRINNLLRCVEAIEKCTGIDEIIIADFHSTDTDFQWVKKVKTPIKIVEVDGDWSIGLGKNCAAQEASGDLLFFLDADLVVTQEIFDKIHVLVPLGYAYSPIMEMQDPYGNFTGNWAMHSFGQIAVTNEQWKANPWPEWTSYGGDDNIFYEPYRDGKAIRDQVLGFYHQWHRNEERTRHYKHEAGTHLNQWNQEHHGNSIILPLAVENE